MKFVGIGVVGVVIVGGACDGYGCAVVFVTVAVVVVVGHGCGNGGLCWLWT